MSGHRLSVRPHEIRALSRREREILEGAVRLVSEQAKAANVIIEEALEAGLHGSDPLPIHAKAVRIELLRIKANVPFSRSSSLLYAALARRARAGQNRVTRGMTNDVRMISTLLPYVDAMFIDKECHVLLTESPVLERIGYSTRLFYTPQQGGVHRLPRGSRVVRP